MNVIDILDELQHKAWHDEALKARLLNTKREANPPDAFCKECQDMGYPIYKMDVICAGEEFHAAMKRSTNGGGENSPMLDGQDDFYELFLASLSMEK